MISEVLVHNRYNARDVYEQLLASNKDVCWITITNTNCESLARSGGNILSLKFNDVTTPDVLTPRQVRKIKTFIGNIVHNKRDRAYTLLINCHAGISRSAAVAKFCEYVYGCEVKFHTTPFPNWRVLERLCGYSNPAAVQYMNL